MSCVAEGNIRCTKCCEVLHVNGSDWSMLERGLLTATDQEIMEKLFVRISKRRAKKINPYIFKKSYKSIDSNYHRTMTRFLAEAAYFTCKGLKNGECTVYEDRPQICRTFKGGYDYSYTCPVDINIIARSVD